MTINIYSNHYITMLMFTYTLRILSCRYEKDRQPSPLSVFLAVFLCKGRTGESRQVPKNYFHKLFTAAFLICTK